MNRPLGGDAIVVGAGMAGLAAAAALAPHFTRVTIFERDTLPDDLTPRNGVGQSHHIHQLLKGGEQALEGLLPGFNAAMMAAGAVPLRAGLDVEVTDFGGVLPSIDAGFSTASLSRPVYEATLRACVCALPGVTIRDGALIERYTVEYGRCTGLELEGGERFTADLLLDASGMNAPLIEQLAADGHADFETESIKINVAYTTGRFSKPAAYRGERRGVFIMPPPPGRHFGLLLPVENDEWIVSLGARGAVAPPRDHVGFLDYAAQCANPEIHKRLVEATPVADYKTFRKTFATRRRIDTATQWPDRLVALGDATSSINPSFGQGMSVAAIQAAELARVLALRTSNGGGLDGFPPDFQPGAFTISERAWSLAINTDYAFPETEGERPENFPMSRAVAGVLRKLCETDKEFLLFRHRLGQMLETGDALREGPLALKFFTALQGSMAPD